MPIAAVRRGLSRVRLPGRFQIVGEAPLRILDVAHNRHAALALAGNLATLPGGGRRLAVFAILADKDAEAVIGAVKDQFDHWHLAGLSGSRGRSADQLAGIFRSMRLSFTLHDDVTAAWRAACHEAEAADTITAFGSFYTVAAVSRLRDG